MQDLFRRARIGFEGREASEAKRSEIIHTVERAYLLTVVKVRNAFKLETLRMLYQFGRDPDLLVKLR